MGRKVPPYRRGSASRRLRLCTFVQKSETCHANKTHSGQPFLSEHLPLWPLFANLHSSGFQLHFSSERSWLGMSHALSHFVLAFPSSGRADSGTKEETET
jgi:hypothetical protein